jgi:uncharacterized membrane protein YhfC
MVGVDMESIISIFICLLITVIMSIFMDKTKNDVIFRFIFVGTVLFIYYAIVYWR